MKKVFVELKILLNLKRASLFILTLPFFIDFTFRFINYGNLPFLKLSMLLIIILICDYLYLKLFSSIKNRPTLFAFILACLLIFFYYSYVLIFFDKINEHTINLNLRVRYILPELFFFIFYVIYRYRYQLNNTLYVLNIFFIILCFIKIIDKTYFENINKEDINKIDLIGHPISLNKNLGNPILLIITDEYASPCELIKNYKDSSIFNYKKRLLNDNWIVKDNIYSEDTLTINSLASIFNFNLQSNDKSLSIPFSRTRLRISALYDSLEKKKVKFYNYGIFDIGKSKAMTKIAFYENENINDNFIIDFFSSTLIYPLLNINQESSWNKHNRLNIEFAKKKVNNIEIKSFVYIHLIMPHGPYEFNGAKYSYKNLANRDKLSNYFDYWKFSNKVLTSLLSDLTKKNNYRIILTGDHGYRGDKRINPHYTYTAFYGFNQKSINSINSVQDLGSLINASY